MRVTGAMVSFIAVESLIRNTPLTWYEFVIIGGAVIGAFWVIWQKLIYPVLNIIKNIERLYPIIPKIDKIAGEFEFNGGETLRDNVVDLNANVKVLREDFSEFKEDVYRDLDFLNAHVIRTREGTPFDGVEKRKEHRAAEKRSRLFRPWKR